MYGIGGSTGRVVGTYTGFIPEWSDVITPLPTPVASYVGVEPAICMACIEF
ncbi:hypothetical protein DPMN_068604 [Dreissena polymorpha]|uniref:Uncharacterized protein n=1 Tax=Dreissena polymorpha TaxID=45954 RepID=A0A9D4BWR9_DREPO|nr:hypothetical protein DPMN_068604 [Dreissena polymorpha]